MQGLIEHVSYGESGLEIGYEKRQKQSSKEIHQ